MSGSFCSPSEDEKMAAEALLLLESSSKPPSPRYADSTSAFFSDEISYFCSSCSKSDSSSCSSCVSDLSSAADSRGRGQCHKLELLALAVSCVGIHRKVLKKARSKIRHDHNKKQRNLLWYGWQIKKVDEVVTPAEIKDKEVEDDAASCLSSTADSNSATKVNGQSCHGGAASLSSGLCETSSRRVLRSGKTAKETTIVEDGRRLTCRGGSRGMWRKAQEIINLLRAKECVSEVGIREALGDSPDTSKALRMLLTMSIVKRSGAGGRGDPFLYMVAGLWTEVDPSLI